MKTFSEYTSERIDESNLNENYSSEQFKEVMKNNKGREGKNFIDHQGNEKESQFVVALDRNEITIYFEFNKGGVCALLVESDDKSKRKLIPLKPKDAKILKSLL